MHRIQQDKGRLFVFYELLPADQGHLALLIVNIIIKLKILMSSIFSNPNLLKLGGTALASLFGLYVLYRSVKSKSGDGDLYINESELTKQRLMMLLEDLRMEYTPYYIHYYHSLCAVHQDYGERPRLVKQLTEKIKERLETKLSDVH